VSWDHFFSLFNKVDLQLGQVNQSPSESRETNIAILVVTGFLQPEQFLSVILFFLILQSTNQSHVKCISSEYQSLTLFRV
jgi:hypothetical protein